MRQHGRWLWACIFVAVSAATALLLTAGCGSSTDGGPLSSGMGTNGNGEQTGDDASNGGTGSSSGGGNPTGSSSGASSSGSSGGTRISDAGTSTGTGSDASTPPTPHGSSTCLKAGSGDYSTMGPYTVTTKSGIDLTSTGDLPTGDAGPATFTAYYPADLNDGCPHPIVSWANGTTVSGSMVYSFFNNNLASWGIVVMASDNPNSAGPSFVGGGGPYNRAGIDYLLKENNDSSSVFYQHLSTRAGVSGHSQGGYAATSATMHPNVEAEVQVEGGGVPKAGIAFLALTGSNDTVVTPGPPMSSYGSATGPSMFAEYTGADHTTTPTIGGFYQKNAGTIQFVRFQTAWFRCFLADDEVACAMFKGGSSCGVCKRPQLDLPPHEEHVTRRSRATAARSSRRQRRETGREGVKEVRLLSCSSSPILLFLATGAAQSAILSSCLPMFSPANRRFRAAGAFSSPSFTSTWLAIWPACTQLQSSITASGARFT